MTTTEYIYKDSAGVAVGTITRIDNKDGTKTFRASAGFPNPRPLYNLDKLSARPEAPIMIVEGEKAADAAAELLPDFVVTTSPFGAKSAGKADWSPVEGRDVTIWPDNDEAGAGYARDVLRLVPHARLVDVGGLPEGWDLADDAPEGADIAELLAQASKPRAKAKRSKKDDLKKSAEDAKRARDAAIAKIRALCSKTVDNGCTEAEADAAFYKAKELMDEHGIGEADLKEPEPEPTFDDIGADLDGDAILNDVYAFLGRFISYPSLHARTAHALWCAHTHMMDIWDSTPRLAFMSPERGSGKTRALETTECLVPRPVHSVNNSVAYVIRKVADDSGRPTILYDEVDALFSNKAPDKADLLALLNAGHRKGATSGRCVVDGGRVRLEELPAYSALALAGLRSLPDTIASRSILIEMRRRAPDETIEPFRDRIHRAQARPIYDELEVWCAYTAQRIAGKYSDMPAEITDRDADCWEPLLAIADAAGGDWPERAREAAVYLVRRGHENIRTDGVELLEHILEAFGDEDRLWTEKLLRHLIDRDESPWADIKGHPLTDRGLATLLRPYRIRSRQVRIGELNRKGYVAEDFYDAWNRYLPSSLASRYKGYKRYKTDNENKNVADVADVALRAGKESEKPCQACVGTPDWLSGKGCPTCKPENYGLPPKVLERGLYD